MDAAILSWALAQAAGTRWRVLAEAYSTGATVVMEGSRRVEYRSLAEMERILTQGYQTGNATAVARPSVTFATFRRAT